MNAQTFTSRLNRLQWLALLVGIVGLGACFVGILSGSATFFASYLFGYLFGWAWLWVA